jgi:hypothetical protein
LRFTVHRPASAEVSPCCHRPSGGDAVCGVDLSVARPRTAGPALENRLALAALRGDAHKPGAATVGDQRCSLLAVWKRPEPAHISNITATTDNFAKGEKRRFLPG